MITYITQKVISYSIIGYNTATQNLLLKGYT